MKKIFTITLILTSYLALCQKFTIKELQSFNEKPWNTCETLLKQKGYRFSEYEDDSKIRKVYTYQINNINNNSLNYIIIGKCLSNHCGGINSFASWHTPNKNHLTTVVTQLEANGYNLIAEKKDGDADTYEYRKNLQRVFIYSEPKINKYVVTASMLNY